LRDAWISTLWLVVLMIALSCTGALLRSHRAQTILLLAWMIGMASLTFLSVPAVGENTGSVLELN